ncbi:putative CBL-interacting protein kinase 3 [Blattamonas nauphoetae]|uniref:CBL-interacting protein kinase 3 n=1 Tax=Blattamonas nauphoetae TaxID=2049346 RepID=A0ABQ9XUC6_9EUKA|nr:putative CBL-interacting protein kinase 3 [Blattamonas nauphoetae]
MTNREVTKAYTATGAGQLPVTVGERLTYIKEASPGWSLCTNAGGTQGYVPTSYIKEVAAGGGGQWVEASSDYTGNPSDPRCIGFKKGDRFELVSQSGAWWTVKHQGAQKLVPGSYMKVSTPPAAALSTPRTGAIVSAVVGVSVPPPPPFIPEPYSVRPKAVSSGGRRGMSMQEQLADRIRTMAEKKARDEAAQKRGEITPAIYGQHSGSTISISYTTHRVIPIRKQKITSTSLNSGIGVPEEYKFIRNISDGGSGSVVEVEEKSTRLHLAAKMIRCISDKDSHRIAREIHRNELFTHPGIVYVTEVVEMTNMTAIVMELGRMSLAQFVADYDQRGVLIPRHLVYRFMVDISAALSFMHNHPKEQTAHADVKMENILLFEGNHAKLCDLGAAESEQTTATCGLGTQQYLSPERINDDTGKASPASDVWALGIVLFQLLFGEPLFKSKNSARILNEILSFKPFSVPKLCGEEERQLLMRMLDPDPVTRVTSKQLSESKMLRCLINTKDELWIIKEQTDKEFQDQVSQLIQRNKELEAQLKIKC